MSHYASLIDPYIVTGVLAAVLVPLLLVIVALLILIGVLATLLILEKRKNNGNMYIYLSYSVSYRCIYLS